MKRQYEAFEKTVSEYKLLVYLLVGILCYIGVSVIASCRYDMKSVKADRIHGNSIKIKRFFACHILACNLALHKRIGQKCQYLIRIGRAVVAYGAVTCGIYIFDGGLLMKVCDNALFNLAACLAYKLGIRSYADCNHKNIKVYRVAVCQLCAIL